MTTQNWQSPAPYGTEDLTLRNSHTADGQPSTTSTAKAEAKEVSREGAEAAKHVAGTAAAEAKGVAQEASSQVKNLVGELGTNLKDQAGSQQQKVAGGLRSLSDELRAMAQKPETPGTAASLVEQAAHHTSEVARWVETKNPGDLLEDVKGFARNRPGTFLAIAAGAGLLVGRLTRGLTAGQQEAQPATGRYVPTAVPAAPLTEPAVGYSAPAAGVDAPVSSADAPFSDPWEAEPTLRPGTAPAYNGNEGVRGL
jgi:hypothetical protein